MGKPSDIEVELLKLTGVKPKAKEARQKLLKRVFDAAEQLPQDQWGQLSTAAQKWYNSCMDALNKAEDEKKEVVLPDLTEPETKPAASADKSPKEAKADEKKAEPQKDDDKDMATKKGKKGAAAKAPKKDKDEKPAKAAATKKAAANGTGEKRNKLQTILAVIFANPKLKTSELVPKIRDKNVDTSESTITTVRSDFIRSARFLHSKERKQLDNFIETLDAE